MAEKNGSIKEEVVEGMFGLLGQIVRLWWVGVIIFVIWGMWTKKIDQTFVNFALEKFVTIANAVKSLIK